MQFLKIPYSFVHKHLVITWREALWGYDHQIFGWIDILDLAIERVRSDSNNQLEIELASLTKTDTQRIGELLRELALFSPDENNILIVKKWLYLTLAWLFENKESFDDPLSEVEIIYSNFDYPREIESFIRYMPVTDDYDPSLHTKNENENRLFENWKRYLDIAQNELRF